jgi:hypothetical protein
LYIDGALAVEAIDVDDEIDASDLRSGDAAGKVGKIELQVRGCSVANVEIAEEAEVGGGVAGDDVSVSDENAVSGVGP